MKVSGGKELPLVSDEANLLQSPGEGAEWQDSVVLLWFDPAQKIGGMYRVGHEANAGDNGMIAVWAHFTSPEGTYLYTDYLPARPEDRPADRSICGGPTCHYRFDAGQHIWTTENEMVSARLVHSDFHDQCEGYPKDSAVTEEFANVHLDIPGQTRGEFTINGKRYEVNALSFRDKGWGERKWDTLLSHRWVAGTLGPQFSFLALSWYASSEDIASFGWVVRDNVLTYAKAVDIVTYTEIDGASNRGGRVKFELTTGEVFEVECTKAVKDSFVSYHHNIACVDTLCEARCGDMVGFADFESTNNIQGGKRRPEKYFGAVGVNGFTPA